MSLTKLDLKFARFLSVLSQQKDGSEIELKILGGSDSLAVSVFSAKQNKALYLAWSQELSTTMDILVLRRYGESHDHYVLRREKKTAKVVVDKEVSSEGDSKVSGQKTSARKGKTTARSRKPKELTSDDFDSVVGLIRETIKKKGLDPDREEDAAKFTAQCFPEDARIQLAFSLMITINDMNAELPHLEALAKGLRDYGILVSGDTLAKVKKKEFQARRDSLK